MVATPPERETPIQSAPVACTVVLLAGPSGSGKSRLTRQLGVPQLRLDDFYRDGDDPDLPMVRSMVDWDDIASWNLEAAVAALCSLVECGSARTPRYNLSTSRAEGTRVVETDGAPVILTEGIFAPDLLEPCRRAGLDVLPIWIDRSRDVNFIRRLRRDLHQHRKPPAVLVRRGLALRGAEPGLRNLAVALGFQPCGMRRARAEISGLLDSADPTDR
ncbi:MAG: uridine kinase [Acidipropionibacterium acidipropionici]|jgi:uridine kinase|uniref:Uridine kinase n=1 Tax=Acidipropionibacterium acidipropionici TaxID=1748 RepID=A0A142KFT9_9ACTN|nr:uridine kinase [Acidipropionibacterium acidipropionici]ALN15519.1 uridine kinase [Acidipropionibacterium acidipropionici]AMS04977.1 uridine kinase [Acidipropionibacterium acidipropionici]AOZ46458.1 uridine kinase [Acidipropionibacterium acidipropionici]APZ08734.1 uridine kinase [Acidipropionibacterium acidipropionici]AZP37493.1 uridine kinase [Acidipropionibacterium acidipropionici]